MAIAASSASSASSSLMPQTLSLRRAIKAGLCPLVSIICTYCMLFKYKDNVYTKHRHIFWLSSYTLIRDICTSSIFAGCMRYPLFASPWGCSEVVVVFLAPCPCVNGSICKCHEPDIENAAGTSTYIVVLCTFFPCVFCNYGRITNGLLSLHTPTQTL